MGVSPTLLERFITLWVIVDPVGTVPVFIAVVRGVDTAQRRRIAVKAVLFAASVLLFFLAFGQMLLETLGITLISFQIAGGIVLFLFALSMIFGESKPESELKLAEKAHDDVAVFPLAVPSLAGPGSMLAVVLLTDSHRYSVADQAATALALVVVLASALLLLLAASPINRLIGEAGASIISRVMGMILAAIAVDAVLDAVNTMYLGHT